MQPQAGKQKPKHPVLASHSTRVPVTVKGQRYEGACRAPQPTIASAGPNCALPDQVTLPRKSSMTHDRKTKSERTKPKQQQILRGTQEAEPAQK